uniref:GAG-pre-integrase domain-containing protein n=1 Tax=Populus alba TaxID=43335 RepID=A0A4U5QNR1_POPAL|nr:hypothetical protein D5086_0000063470 [Populus alba]
MADGLYPINLQQFPHHSFNLLANKVSGNLWHARLGHPHHQVISRLSEPSLRGKIEFCESSNHKGYCCLEPQSGRIYISRHVKFNELHFPFKTDALSKSANTRLFQLQSIPKFLDHHALSQPQHRLPTNEESATEVTEYPSSEVHPAAMSPSRSSSSLQTHEVFIPEPATYQSSESQPTVVSSSPFEPINNLPSRIHPMITRAQTGSLKPK